MFVTNHVLSGAIIGHLLKRRPAAAFAVGVASHLALDAVPHWGCDVRRTGAADQFLAAAKRDGILGLVGLAILALSAPEEARPAVISGMAGAVLLDLDKPMLHFFGKDPFPKAVQQLHKRVQNESPQGLPNEIRFGVGFAVADAVLSALAHRADHRKIRAMGLSA